MQVSHNSSFTNLKLNELSINYRDVGNGASVVLLLHGWGSHIGNFRQLETILAKNFRVVSLDLPGFGATSVPVSVWSLQDYVHFVKSFMQALNLERPAILGHSFGGRIAICLGEQNLASRIILANSAGVLPKKSFIKRAKVLLYKFAKYFLLVLPQSLRTFVLEYLQRKFGASDYRNASPIMRKILVKVVNEDLTGKMPHITAPTLLIWGKNDTVTSLEEQAKIMEQTIPNSGLVVIEGAGHYSFLDKPVEFALIAESFLKRAK